MRGPQPRALTLTTRQHALLQQITRQRTAPAARVARAHIILRAAAGANNSHMSQHLGVDRGQVRLWRARWIAAAPTLATAEAADPADLHLEPAIEHLLAAAPRPGTPPTFTPHQIVQIVALACEPPAESGRPISHWTPRELADEAVQRQIVPRISARAVGRFLK